MPGRGAYAVQVCCRHTCLPFGSMLGAEDSDAMKDQYFGDINDYRKYGLLRAIIQATGFRLLVAWMLTPDDDSTDGKFISYLEHPGERSHHDPELFRTLNELLLVHGQKRRVSLLEDTDLLPNTEYFSDRISDAVSSRRQWFSSLAQRAHLCDFVFLDPDNGLEIKSKAFGGKGSSKFLYWREVDALWASGKSLLIYQHFIREKRVNFIARMLDALRVATPGSIVEAFSTPHVVFLLALQPEHKRFHEAIVNSVQKDWRGQICIGSWLARNKALPQVPAQVARA